MRTRQEEEETTRRRSDSAQRTPNTSRTLQGLSPALRPVKAGNHYHQGCEGEFDGHRKMAELRNRLKKERRKRGKYSCKGREDAIRMKEDRQCTISHRKLGDATRVHHLVTKRQSKINDDDGCAYSHFTP